MALWSRPYPDWGNIRDVPPHPVGDPRYYDRNPLPPMVLIALPPHVQRILECFEKDLDISVVLEIVSNPPMDYTTIPAPNNHSIWDIACYHKKEAVIQVLVKYCGIDVNTPYYMFAGQQTRLGLTYIRMYSWKKDIMFPSENNIKSIMWALENGAHAHEMFKALLETKRATDVITNETASLFRLLRLYGANPSSIDVLGLPIMHVDQGGLFRWIVSQRGFNFHAPGVLEVLKDVAKNHCGVWRRLVYAGFLSAYSGKPKCGCDICNLWSKHQTAPQLERASLKITLAKYLPLDIVQDAGQYVHMADTPDVPWPQRQAPKTPPTSSQRSALVRFFWNNTK